MEFQTFVINRIICEIKKEIDESDINKLYKITINLMKEFNIITFNDFNKNRKKYIEFIKLNYLKEDLLSDKSSDDSSDDESSDESYSLADESEYKSRKNKCTKYDNCMTRLKTFLKWQLTNECKPFITPVTFVQAGFYYTGKKDTVKCFDCEIELSEWKEGDVPLDEHKKHNTHCNFINSIYVPKNIREKYQKRFIKSFTKKN